MPRLRSDRKVSELLASCIRRPRHSVRFRLAAFRRHVRERRHRADDGGPTIVRDGVEIAYHTASAIRLRSHGNGPLTCTECQLRNRPWTVTRRAITISIRGDDYRERTLEHICALHCPKRRSLSRNVPANTRGEVIFVMPGSAMNRRHDLAEEQSVDSWSLIDTAQVPGGGELRLMRRGAELSIRLGHNELMNSRVGGSGSGARHHGVRAHSAPSSDRSC